LSFCFILKVNEQHGLSPGKFSEKRFKELDGKRKRRATQQNTVIEKKNRLRLKEERLSGDHLLEVIEGPTYQSCVADVATTADDIETIPTPITAPPPSDNVNVARRSVVVFDLETTGLGERILILRV
jgi:hypothetical protein